MANLDFSRIKQAPWKVDVFDRLSRVKSDIKRGIGVKGWSLVEQDGSWTISPSEDQLQDNQERDLRGRALAVVTVYMTTTITPGNASSRPVVATRLGVADRGASDVRLYQLACGRGKPHTPAQRGPARRRPGGDTSEGGSLPGEG